jgi:hypothetical protein
MPKYRPKAIVIEACQWLATEESWQDMLALWEGSELLSFRNLDGTLSVPIYGGPEVRKAALSDWIIRRGEDRFEIMHPIDFDLTYEPAR